MQVSSCNIIKIVFIYCKYERKYFYNLSIYIVNIHENCEKINQIL